MNIKTLALAVAAAGLMAAPAVAQTPAEVSHTNGVYDSSMERARTQRHLDRMENRADRVQERAADRVERVEDRANRAAERANQRVDHMENRMGEARENAREFISDADTTANVKAHLLRQRGLEGHRIQVDTRDGVVTLTGTVANDTQKGLAERTAMEIRGIDRIDNQLDVNN